MEATDSISTPGILEVTAVEYYANQNEDDVENGIVGGLLEEIQNPNDTETEETIIGETFIKPKTTYEYRYDGAIMADWGIDREGVPLKVERTDDDHVIKLTWTAAYSG